MAIDISCFYGYKRQHSFYIENNGANPIDVVSVDLVNEDVFTPNNIFTEIENTLPMVVAGNSRLDIMTNWYSINVNDFTSDLTYLVQYNIIDMTDFTTIIDSTSVDVTFDLVNGSVFDETNHDVVDYLSKYFKVGPSGEDTTINSSNFTTTGYPIIQFDDRLKFHLFLLKYTPQFAVFNNIANQTHMIVGSFYYNYEQNSIECYFTDSEKSDALGFVFNNLFLFYTET